MAWKPNPDIRQLKRIEKELKAESDRGSAIMSCAMIDWAFERMLKNFMVPSKCTEELLRPGAELGGFGSRIKISYSIGLLTKDKFIEYNLLRKIRNEFAHKFEVNFSFENPKVKTFCKSLAFSETSKGKPAKNSHQMFINSSLSIIRGILFRKQLPEDQIKEGEHID